MARVLMVYEPPDGGVPVNVMQLALGMGAHGHEVEVAGPARSTVADALRDGGIITHAVDLRRGYGRPDRDAAATAALRRLIRRGGFDVVHCHASKAGALGRPAARAAGVPTVYSPHCFGFVGDVSRRRRVLATAIERALGRTCTDAIVCVCDDERSLAVERRIADPERLSRIYPAVLPCPDADHDPALAALAAGGPVAGTITQLRAQKRVDLLIAAAPSVLERVPDARIAVIGNGDLEPELRAQAASLGLDRDPRFAFIPFRTPSARYLRDLGVFVLSSAWEAMPASVLEALSCGVPQVSADVGGVREALDDRTGVVVPALDAQALADAMVAVLSDPARREAMATASRERWARGEFTIERMVAETAALYRVVAGGE
jgi:glycosyltransferase involved in cell wall biosynthesis